jgi:zinc protease
MFGQQAVVPNDSRFRAALVMNYLLDDRLNKSLREKNGLVYNVTTDLNFFKKSAVFIGSTATETQSVPKLQELVRSEWARVLGGDIPMDELSYAKINMQGKFNQNMRFPWARALYLMTALEYDLGMDYLSKRNKLVDAVTREDVRSVARDLLRPDDLFFVIVGRHKPEDFQNINKTE